VTGGGRGLGRNTAISAARSGFDVIITYHSNRDAAAEVVSEIEGLGRKAVAVRLDTADVGSFDAFAASLRSELGRLGHENIHALVNNAGIGLDAPFATTSEVLFDRLVNIHFKGVFFPTQKLLPIISDGGRIVNLCFHRVADSSRARRGARRYRTCYRGVTVHVPSPDKRSAYRSVRGMGALSLSATRCLDRTR